MRACDKTLLAACPRAVSEGPGSSHVSKINFFLVVNVQVAAGGERSQRSASLPLGDQAGRRVLLLPVRVSPCRARTRSEEPARKWAAPAGPSGAPGNVLRPVSGVDEELALLVARPPRRSPSSSLALLAARMLHGLLLLLLHGLLLLLLLLLHGRVLRSTSSSSSSSLSPSYSSVVSRALPGQPRSTALPSKAQPPPEVRRATTARRLGCGCNDHGSQAAAATSSSLARRPCRGP